MDIKRIHINKNMVCLLLTVLMIVAYLLVDGLGMFINSFNVIRIAEGNLSTSSSDDFDSYIEQFVEEDQNSYIVSDMKEQCFARMVYLFIALFPIVFLSLRFCISFKTGEATEFKKWLPILRLVFGIFVFYYALTLNTLFSHEVFTNYYSFGVWKFYFRIVGAFSLFGAFILDWPAFVAAIKRFPTSHPRTFKGLFILCISIFSCMITEFLIGSKMNMSSNMLFFNILYWAVLQIFIDLISRNVKIGAFVSLGLSYLVGLINDVVYQFRGNYIMYGDLTVVRTALEVAGNYTYKPEFWFWISLGLLILAIVVTVVIKFPKNKKLNMKEAAVRGGFAVILVISVVITFRNGMLYKNIFGKGWDYNENVKYVGYIPYFLSNMNSIQTVTLDGYSADLAAEVLDMNEEDAIYTYPNIIIIQNEAFSDLAVLFDIETNQDYMPFIHSLTENTQKGYLNMSLTGGPTANTEFEILTRSTLGFLPYGSVPYTQYINDDLPSTVQVLRNQAVPYYTTAYHPYYSSGYRRSEVYNHFGFDQIVFEDNFQDDFPASDLPRNYLSDSADYRRVEQMYEEFRSHSDAPWFCFNVTIQNHGGYTQEYEPSEEERIFVTNFDAPDSLNSYLSLIKTSDDAFRELIEYFSQCDEPTIIAMYGDHQPTLEHEAYEVLADYATAPVNQYYVPYVIWANYDIEESNTLGNNNSDMELNTLSTNYFVSVIFDIAGIELSDYDRYLLDLHERVPAITAIGVWDSEGNYYPSPAESPFADELSVLEMIQYNLIFDDDNRLTDRFE